MRTKSLLIAGFATLILIVAGFTFLVDQSTMPESWVVAGSKPKDYDMGKDSKVVHSGSTSAFIRSNQSSIQGFGTMMQTFKADMYFGKRVRMSGFIKTEDVKTWSSMWMRVDDKANPNQSLAFDNMANRSVKGTTDWTKCEIVLDVPANASNIAFGFLLDGTGKIWFDDIKFEVVDQSVPTTDLKNQANQLPTSPMNLDFEK
jgi:hypothetical protein